MSTLLQYLWFCWISIDFCQSSKPSTEWTWTATTKAIGSAILVMDRQAWNNINPPRVSIVDNSFPRRALSSIRPERVEKAVDPDHFYILRTIYFRLGMLVLERKLSSWGIWICNHYIDYGQSGYSRKQYTKANRKFCRNKGLIKSEGSLRAYATAVLHVTSHNYFFITQLI